LLKEKGQGLSKIVCELRGYYSINRVPKENENISISKLIIIPIVLIVY
jgi:hypothetical protein